MGVDRLKIDERRFWRRKARHLCRRLQCHLHRRLKDRNATAVTGLAIIVIRAMPVERRVEAKQAHRDDEDDDQ